MTAFDPRDSGTWPVLLDVHQVAEIYHRTVSAIRDACKPSSKSPFTPRPYRMHPFLWRRADVIRDVEGARGISAIRRAG